MTFLFPWTPRRPERAPHDESLPPFPDRVLNESSEPPVFQVPRRPVAAVLKDPPSDSNSAESVEKELPTPPAQPKFYGIALPGWVGLRKERYFGLPRRTVILIAVGSLLLLALILGLGIGLTARRRKGYVSLLMSIWMVGLLTFLQKQRLDHTPDLRRPPDWRRYILRAGAWSLWHILYLIREHSSRLAHNLRRSPGGPKPEQQPALRPQNLGYTRIHPWEECQSRSRGRGSLHRLQSFRSGLFIKRL